MFLPGQWLINKNTKTFSVWNFGEFSSINKNMIIIIDTVTMTIL